jgi:hypothetical protein
MIPDKLGSSIGNSGPVGHAVGHDRTSSRAAFRVFVDDIVYVESIL